MNTKNDFSLDMGDFILVTFSLGCKLVTGVSEAIAIATQVDIEGWQRRY